MFERVTLLVGILYAETTETVKQHAALSASTRELISILSDFMLHSIKGWAEAVQIREPLINSVRSCPFGINYFRLTILFFFHVLRES
jgi:hypothetical protein